MTPDAGWGWVTCRGRSSPTRPGGLSRCCTARRVEVLTPHLAQLHRRAELRVSAEARPSGLTPRELEILSLVAEGRTNIELARILWISPHTVRKHLENAFDKLGVHARAAAVVRAFGKPPRPTNDRSRDTGT